MSREVGFKLAEPNDAVAVLGMLRQLSEETDTFFIDADLDEIDELDIRKYIDIISTSDRNLMGLAEIDGQPIGIVTVDYLKNDQGELGVAVLKQYQGHGLGTNLVELAIEWAAEYSNLGEIFLVVLKDNLPAVHIYEKLGFRTHKQTTVDGEEALLMSLPV
ncbi:GNAT family N-acetyltransferase [Lentilactobacillus sp. Marseille-Q4993]|uniref:GNAT family N-acetyltransferase n=1 Tax=Lentilactobacillus sp. Marseille-Q4993 TaxID=3039492 RepID=UPI0024BC642B|nr:GNAT family N-acetyltransferase [Lentilactobacillus sp. Marseille-Q4993]